MQLDERVTAVTRDGDGANEAGEAATAAVEDGSASGTAGTAAEEDADEGADEGVHQCGAVQMCKAVYELLLMRPGTHKAENSTSMTSILAGSRGWGDVEFVFCDEVSQWQEVEQALRGLVGADGRLHMRAVVTALE